MQFLFVVHKKPTNVLPLQTYAVVQKRNGALEEY